MDIEIYRLMKMHKEQCETSDTKICEEFLRYDIVVLLTSPFQSLFFLLEVLLQVIGFMIRIDSLQCYDEYQYDIINIFVNNERY